MKVYVAAPYADAPMVRELHNELCGTGWEPTSTWAEIADAAEDFTLSTPSQLRKAAQANDADIMRSHVLLVIAREGAGGEMFAEARLALVHGIPVVWVGRFVLSAWRHGVTRCATVAEGLQALQPAVAKTLR